METRQLGDNGPTVSRLAFGAMTLGKESDEKTGRELLDAYVDAGGTFVDTSDNYNEGESERIIGRWLQDRAGARDRIVLATKGRFMVDGQPGASLRPEYLRTALDASLGRLGVDHVDVYQLHGPDADHPIDGVVEFLTEAVASGKVRHVGVSNLPGWQVTKLAMLLAEHGGPPLVSHQVQYSLLSRGVEWEMVPAAMDAGLGTITWGSLGQGWLTGKYVRDNKPGPGTRVGDAEDWYLEGWGRRNVERTWTIIDLLTQVAADHGVTPGQAALAWTADRPGITAPIVGARNLDQLSESLGAPDLHLDEDAMKALTEASVEPAQEYPYQFLDMISHWHS